VMSAANSAARNHQAAEKSPEARTGQSGPSENGSAGGGRRPRSGIDGRTTDKKSADRKQSAGTGAKAAEPANASGAQEMETWVQDTAESELAIDGLDHPADLDAVVDIAVVDVEVDVDVEIDEVLDEADLSVEDVADVVGDAPEDEADAADEPVAAVAAAKPAAGAAAPAQGKADEKAADDGEDDVFVYGDDDDDQPAAQVAAAGATADPARYRCSTPSRRSSLPSGSRRGCSPRRSSPRPARCPARMSASTSSGLPRTAAGPRIICSRQTCAWSCRSPSGTQGGGCCSSTSSRRATSA